MEPLNSRRRNLKIFAWIVLGCTALAVGYTVWVIQRNNAKAPLHQAESPRTSLPTARPEELQAIQNGPHLVFLHQEGPHYGLVNVAGLDSEFADNCIDGQCPGSAQTGMKCDRVYYAAGNGICLLYDTSVTVKDPLAAVQLWVILFGPDFQPRQQFTVEGIPSRARVSSDGKYAVFTVFVTGHSYADANMSTATILLDTATGASLGNLEEFEVWKDGQHFQAPEFNFWGVTFAQDSNRFYATLRHGYKTYLVQGDVAARRLTILREDVECPSLSPDGTRIVFKKLLSTGTWRLTLLDLATMQETPLAEEENVDDQVEWLDNEHVLYQKEDLTLPDRIGVFLVPANGSGTPELFVPNATSPVVVR